MLYLLQNLMKLSFKKNLPGHRMQTERVHKTFRRRPGRLLKALCTFNLRPVSRGIMRISFNSFYPLLLPLLLLSLLLILLLLLLVILNEIIFIIFILFSGSPGILWNLTTVFVIHYLNIVQIIHIKKV